MFSRPHRSKRPSDERKDQQKSLKGNIDSDKDGPSENDTAFECNICLETARDSVVSMCGHLFCWPCLYQWMYSTDSVTQSHDTCPVCKAAISRDKIIPIYGRGGDESNRQDPRDKLPPRPAGQRTEIPNQNQFAYSNVWGMGGPGAQMFSFGEGGFHVSFGIGSLPQYILAYLQEYAATHDRRNDTDFFLMRFFAICGILCIVMTIYFG